MKYLKLFESYKSQKDLEEFSKNILHVMCEKTLDSAIMYNRKVNSIENISFSELNPNYDTLKDFIEEFNYLKVIIITQDQLDIPFKDNGMYVKFINKKDIKEKWILLKLQYDTLDKFNNFFVKWKDKGSDYNKTDDLLKDIVYSLYDDYKHTLIHELQHAYDEWRSDNKYSKTSKDFEKDAEKYRNIDRTFYDSLDFDLKNADNNEKDEWEFMSKHHITYLNLKHEVDARFTAAIQKTEFYEWDFEKTDELGYMVNVIKPFKDVLREFKLKMYPFVILTDKDKKRVTRKLGQFYELEKDFVKKKNDERSW